MNTLKAIICFSLLLSSITSFFSCQDNQPKANLILTNANIWTGNSQQKSAQAMAIAGDTILAIGTNEAIQQYKGESTEVVDAQGQFVTPGFIDPHVHLFMGGNSLLSVQLRDAKTPEEFTQKIGTYAKTLKTGEWVLEGNWDHTMWGGELPTKEWIDAITKDNPVVIYRLDGHMVLANSLALKLAGIDKNTPDVPGGEIIRSANGEPTGILKDNAMIPVLSQIPTMSPAEKERSFKAAMNYFLANGVTTFHDLDSVECYTTAKRLKEKGELKMRVYAIHPIYKWNQPIAPKEQSDKWIKTGGVKGFVDGSLGSHTAAFHDDYTDKPNDKGFFIHEKEDLYQWISDADKADLQIMVHAIGDSAIHSLLNIFEKVISENGIKDRRMRVEHVQHIAPRDIKRFAELGIIASVQPYHAIDDGRWAEEVIGAERIKTTYAFKALIDGKAKVAFGSDWPVAPASPLAGIYAATTRQTLDGKNPDGWVAEQKVTVEQALLAYTRDAAYASFDEDIKGTLEVGKLADFVILNGDLLTVEPSAIRDLEILETYVGGEKVYDRENN